MSSSRLLDDSVVFALLPAAADASAQTTASGSWVNIENWVGDALIIVNCGSVTGSFGSLKVQVECSAANTGASSAACTDPRAGSGTGYSFAAGSSLLTITADGCYCMPLNVDAVANNFIGVVCTYTTITATVMSVEIVGRLKTN